MRYSRSVLAASLLVLGTLGGMHVSAANLEPRAVSEAPAEAGRDYRIALYNARTGNTPAERAAREEAMAARQAESQAEGQTVNDANARRPYDMGNDGFRPDRRRPQGDPRMQQGYDRSDREDMARGRGEYRRDRMDARRDDADYRRNRQYDGRPCYEDMDEHHERYHNNDRRDRDDRYENERRDRDDDRYENERRDRNDRYENERRDRDDDRYENDRRDRDDRYENEREDRDDRYENDRRSDDRGDQYRHRPGYRDGSLEEEDD